MTKILVLDDDEENLVMMSDIADSLGFDVLCANTFNQAVEVIREVIPEVILIDMALNQQYDGVDFIQQVRNHLFSEQIYIIAVTADLFRYPREFVLESGADCYLAKPFRFSEIHNLLTSFL